MGKTHHIALSNRKQSFLNENEIVFRFVSFIEATEKHSESITMRSHTD